MWTENEKEDRKRDADECSAVGLVEIVRSWDQNYTAILVRSFKLYIDKLTKYIIYYYFTPNGNNSQWNIIYTERLMKLDNLRLWGLHDPKTNKLLKKKKIYKLCATLGVNSGRGPIPLPKYQKFF